MLGGGAGRFCTPSSTTGPFRLFAVSGFQNRTNDIVYCPPIIKNINENEDDSTAIIYFGGDVQDFPESMETNRDSRGYLKYNLENSAILLRNAFPRAHIIVVRPVRMEFKTFSCFDNFVRGNNAGVPDHTPLNHALQHLEKLLQNLSHRLISIPENDILLNQETTRNENNIENNSKNNSSGNTSNQDIDIDILQVQDNITVDTDGKVVPSSNSDSINNSFKNQVQESTESSVIKTDNSQSSEQNNDKSEMILTSSNEVENNCQTSNQILPLQKTSPLWWRQNLNLDKSKLILIGFSKGCVVLNQFIYEFHYLKTLTPDDSSMGRLLTRIKDMYWLDGGHGGQKNTWITSRSLLETLTRMGINIHVHVTPYQVQDDRRPWIRKEEKIFTDLLRRLGASITRHIHFETTTPNLVTHFEVLQAFCQHIHILQQQHLQLQQQRNLSESEK
ncbi:C2orf69 family protein [Megaselia abdita]